MVPSSQIMAPARRRRDRISDLPDDVLGHVLSFLPTCYEAGRAAVLCRRWRYVFGHVHTVLYEEQAGGRSCDWETWSMKAEELKSRSDALLNGINGALLSRRRCAGGHVPLRSLRFAFDDFNPECDKLYVDQWLSYVTEYGGRELQHLDLRFLLGPTCAGDGPRRTTAGLVYENCDSDGDHEIDRRTRLYLLPRRLFSCTALKTLCLGYCRLKLPAEVNLPCLETLRLTGIRHDSGTSIQRLVLSCPRLADLALEAVRHLRTLSVLHRRLRRFAIRRFAIRCCHAARSVHID